MQIISKLGTHQVTPEAEILMVLGLIIMCRAWGSLVIGKIESRHKRANEWELDLKYVRKQGK